MSPTDAVISCLLRRGRRPAFRPAIRREYSTCAAGRQAVFSVFSPAVGCNIKCERTSPLFSGSFEPSAFIFFIPQTTINRNRNGVKTWREIIGIWILRIERRSRRGTPAGIARLKSPRDLACIPRRSTTNCNEAIPEKWTRRNARFTARSGRKRWFGKTSSAEAAVR